MRNISNHRLIYFLVAIFVNNGRGDIHQFVEKSSAANSIDYGSQMELLIGELDETNICLTFATPSEWWSYRWCHKTTVEQFHINLETNKIEDAIVLGNFVKSESHDRLHVFTSKTYDCIVDNVPRSRHVVLKYHCCYEDIHATTSIPDVFIYNILEPRPCRYEVSICYKKICDLCNEIVEKKAFNEIKKTPADLLIELTPEILAQKRQQNVRVDYQNKHPIANTVTKFVPGSSKTDSDDVKTKHVNVKNSDVVQYKAKRNFGPYFPPEKLREIKERVRNMFYHGYNNYMKHAYPQVRAANSLPASSFLFCALDHEFTSDKRGQIFLFILLS